MATYKVPQDVEADDKLIGPFSFRQFIYLIAVALAGALAWGLAQIFIGLAVIPLPIIIFFGALALPLRKDQPMEIYMAAMVSFYLKPRLRKWDPEGIETLISITAPKTVEVQRTKNLSQSEAEQRLSYLANIVDTQGWAIRGVSGAGTAMNTDVYLEAQSAEDVLDTNTSIAHNFDQMMNKSTERAREEAKQRMMQAAQPQPAPAQTFAPATAPVQQQPYPQQQMYTQDPTPAPEPLENMPIPEFNPYPEIHQSVIQPLDNTRHAQLDHAAGHPAEAAQTTTKTEVASASLPGPLPTPAPKTPAKPGSAYKAPEPLVEEKEDTTSDIDLTAGIINLANNPDLSIETIAHEAKRLHKKAKEESDEVVISLR